MANLKLANDGDIGYILRESYYNICGNLCTVSFTFVFSGKVPESPITLRFDNLPVEPKGLATYNAILWGENLADGKGLQSPQMFVLRRKQIYFNILGKMDSYRELRQANTTWLTENTVIGGTFTYEI